MTIWLPQFILGIDPGKKSGVALLDLFTETCGGVEVPFEQYGDHIEDLIARLRPDVVCESFVINANTVKNTQAPWSLESLGVARFLARKYGCRFTTLAPSSAKRFATDERLRRLGWRIPGKGHLADAQRQALLHAVNAGWWHVLLDDDSRDTIAATV